MKIPKKILDKWIALKSTGDAAKLSEINKEYSDETFRRALITGECNEDVFKALGDFYNERMEIVKQYL